MNLTPSSLQETAPVHDTGAVETSQHTEAATIFSLHVLRGIALLSLLVISIWQFGGFSTAEQNFYRTGPHGGNYSLLTAVSFLFEGKMTALFALVFGAGIVLFMQKRQPVLIGVPDAYIRRQLWLLIFGVFNAFILLWPGDILYPFAIVGILLFAFWRFSAKGLFFTALFFLLIFFGKQFWNYADDKKDYKKYLAVTLIEKRIIKDSTARAIKDSVLRNSDTTLIKVEWAKNKLQDSIAKKKDTLTKKQAEEKGKWEGAVKSLKYDSAKVKATNKAMRAGSYGKVWNHVMKQSQDKESFWLYRIGLWELGSMMLLGMALLKFGFFEYRVSTSKYFLISFILIAIGLSLAWYRLHYNNIRLADYAKYVEKFSLPYDQFLPAENMCMATGYAALVLWLLRLNVFKWLWQILAITGSMALTNYILQCVICSFFFYGYGFGYFGRLEQWELYAGVLEIAMIQIVFSVLWLRYYSMGPLEWLWTCLIYKKWLPNKKQILLTDLPMAVTAS